LHAEILLAQGSPDARKESDRERDLLDRLGHGETPVRHPAFRVLYANLAVNYIDLAAKELKNGDRTGAQLSLKSLAGILPQLTGDDRESAQESYRELLQQVQPKRSSRN